MAERRGGSSLVGGVAGLVCALMIPATALAQAGADLTIRDLGDARLWRRFDLGEHGLPDPPMAVVEDGSGTPWALLSDGLAYYDGIRWVRVADLEWPAREQLERVALADHGLVLIVGGRVFRVDEGGARAFDLAETAGAAVATGAAELDNGELLLQVVASGGEAPPTTSLVRLAEDGARAGSVDAPAQPVPTDRRGLWRSRSGALWINSVTGLWVRREGEWSLHLPVTPGDYLDVIAHDEGPDGSGALAIRHPTDVRGLWTWGARGDLTHHRLEDRGTVRALAVLDEGRVLVTMESDRASLVDADGWHDMVAAGQLARARQLFVGADGRVWSTGTDGLHLYWPRYGMWRTLPGTAAGLAGHVNEILPRADGSLWLATGDGLRIVRADGGIDAIREIDGMPLATVTGLAEDPDGNVWISSGSSFRGVWRWDGAGWRQSASGPIDDGYFHRIVRDRSGRLWFLGLRYTGYMFTDGPGVGVWVLDGTGPNRWEHDGELPSLQVYGFAEGPDGSLWFATMGGLARLRDGDWTRWGEAEGLETPRVFDVAVGGDGRAYFTHAAYGLGVVDADDTIRYLGERDGLPVSTVWRLLPEDDSLWLAGQGGVGLYRDGRFASVGLTGNLTSQLVWPLAIRDGELLAGTQGRGVVRLDRGALPDTPVELQLHETLLEGESVRIDWTVLYAWQQLPGTEILTRHRLDEGTWSDWSTARSVRIRDLEPGEHVLTVESSGLLANSSGSSTTRFRAPLPLYRNPLFYGPICGLLALLLTTGAVSWRRRLRQEQQVRRSERRHRSLFVNASDVIFTSDLDWRLTNMNPAGLRALGYTAEEIPRLTVDRLLAPEFHTAASEMLQLKLQGRVSTTYEAELVARDGSRLPVELSSQLLTEDDRVIGVQGFARDIRDRKAAERTLHNIAQGVSADTGDDFFRSLMESLAGELGMDIALIAVLERGGNGAADPARMRTLTFWSNGRLRDNIEYPLAGTPCDGVIAGGACIYAAGVQALFPDDTMLQEESIEGYAGTPLLDSSGEPLGIMVLMSRRPLPDERLASSMLQIFAIRAAAEIEKMRTAAALQRTEEELRQAQKMEAIGRLAGGIAHDFNNLLTVVTGHAELALAETAGDDPRREDLEHIATAGHSAARLTTQLLALSRRQAVEAVPLRPNDAIRGLEPLLARVTGPDIRLILELDEQAGGLLAGAGHLEQILMNLVVNAVDASPDGGRILVRTRRVVAGAHGHGGEQLLLEVEDEGTGMDAETLQRVFEPFFTTKEPGRGTGLGLSTVYGIVQQSGGDVSITSEPGSGTCVRMTWNALPAAELAALDGDEAVPDAEGQERVLVVEDDGMVRGFVHRSLDRLGYRVASAGSAREALERIEGGEEFDLLLSDIVMPGMDGPALARRVRDLAPATRILLMSGYADSAGLSTAEAGSYLQKPFTPADLARRVREVLDSPP